MAGKPKQLWHGPYMGVAGDRHHVRQLYPNHSRSRIFGRKVLQLADPAVRTAPSPSVGACGRQLTSFRSSTCDHNQALSQLVRSVSREVVQSLTSVAIRRSVCTPVLIYDCY